MFLSKSLFAQLQRLGLQIVEKRKSAGSQLRPAKCLVAQNNKKIRLIDSEKALHF